MKYIILVLILISSSAWAATLKGGYVACVSEGLYEKLSTAVAQEDIRRRKYLFNKGCFITKEGIPVSILDRSILGPTKVRAYGDSTSVIIWTQDEAIKEE